MLLEKQIIKNDTILLLLFINILFLTSYNNKIVKSWKGRELKIPILQTKILGKDTIYDNLWNSE